MSLILRFNKFAMMTVRSFKVAANKMLANQIKKIIW